MLSPLTILEVHDLLLAARLDRHGITVKDVRQFVNNHAVADLVSVARDESGDLHGVAFGWPIRSAVDYGGGYVEEPDGEIFYCNLIVTGQRKDGPPAEEIIAILKQRVQEAWPDVRYFCYQRAKHGNRMRLYQLERLTKHG